MAQKYRTAELQRAFEGNPSNPLSAGETEAPRRGSTNLCHTKIQWQLGVEPTRGPLCVFYSGRTLFLTSVSQSQDETRTISAPNQTRSDCSLLFLLWDESSLGSSLSSGNEPEPGRTWAKEGDSQEEGQARSHAHLLLSCRRLSSR